MEEATNHINSKNDFVIFIRLLLQDLKDNPQKWENNNLTSYFEAMASWIEDMDGYYINQGQSIPQNVNWKVFADTLMAAKIYE